MKTETQLTAVEFLISQLGIKLDGWNNDVIKEAKAMEKQHIIDAYKQAHEDGYHFEGSVSDYEAERLEEYLAEQYYNETFKSE